MFSRVLLATDFSEPSERTLECVAAWRRLGLMKVTLAHVHDVRTSGGLEDLVRQRDEPLLARQKDRLVDVGLWVSTRLEVGTPYVEIDRIAREESCEAIVLGSHGASWMKEVMLGSVADGVLRHSTLPVVIIKVNRFLGLPVDRCEAECRSIFERILLATDFSERAAHAERVAASLCASVGSDAFVVHVTSAAGPQVSNVDEAARPLDAIANGLRDAGARSVATTVLEKHATPGILEAVETLQPTLVILGAHGQGHVAEAIVGSTAHAIAHRSPVPVLLVPLPGDDGAVSREEL